MHRQTNATVFLVLLLASCATPIPTFQAQVPCETAAFTVVDDFVGARRGDCTVLSGTNVRLTIRPEDEDVTNPSAWYAFKLIPNSASVATISLQYADAYHRYVPKTSRDGIHWTPIEEGSVSETPDGSVATFTLALDDSPLWVSAQELVTPAIYSRWSEKIARETDAELGVLGISRMNRAIEVLAVSTESKEVLLLTGRQHPPEVSGLSPFRLYIVSAITAFWTWRRFSAWSKTRLWGPSMTASVTSMLRSAGSGCM